MTCRNCQTQDVEGSGYAGLCTTCQSRANYWTWVAHDIWPDFGSVTVDAVDVAPYLGELCDRIIGLQKLGWDSAEIYEKLWELDVFLKVKPLCTACSEEIAIDYDVAMIGQAYLEDWSKPPLLCATCQNAVRRLE